MRIIRTVIIGLLAILTGCLAASQPDITPQVVNTNPLATMKVVETLVGFPVTGVVTYVAEDSVRRQFCYVIIDARNNASISCTPIQAASATPTLPAVTLDANVPDSQ